MLNMKLFLPTFLSLPTAFLSLAALTLSACGGVGEPLSGNTSSSSSSSALSSSAASNDIVPLVQVLFPTKTSTLNADTVLLRGIVTDSSGSVARVSVNGVAVATEDNYAHWQVRVPLLVGANKISVLAVDKADNALAESVLNVERISVDEQPIYGLPGRDNLMLDSARNRLLMLDATDLVAIDLSSGLRKVVVKSVVGSMLADSHAMTLDAERNRVLVVDGHDIVAVDLTSAATTLFYDGNTLGGLSWITNPSGIALDTAHNRALVTIYKPAVTAVNLSSGEGSMFLAPAVDCFGSANDIVMDADDNRALVVNNDSVVAVSLADASCTKLIAQKNLVAIDGSNNRAIEADKDGIFAVDFTSGARRVLSAGAAAIDLHSFALDLTRNRAFFLQRNSPSVYAVDLLTGERVIFSK